MGYFQGRLSSKGQFTLPAEVRKEIGLPPGGRFRIETKGDGKAVIIPKKRGAYGLKGIFSKPPHPIDDDAEIEATVLEKTRPGRAGPRP